MLRLLMLSRHITLLNAMLSSMFLLTKMGEISKEKLYVTRATSMDRHLLQRRLRSIHTP